MSKKLKLQNKLINAKKSLEVFRKVLETDLTSVIYRDSAIKRFEFTLEICWKLCKAYLAISTHELNSPKAVFRELAQYDILTEDEVALALEMVDDRNETSHDYSESKASELAAKLPTYYKLIEKIINHPKIALEAREE